MKELYNPFKDMKPLEYVILIASTLAALISFILIEEKDYLYFFTCILGVTTTVFIAKAHVFGQLLGIAYAILYAVTTFISHYYGEFIISIALYLPSGIWGLISWLRHRYEDTSTIKIAKLGLKHISIMLIIASILTFGIFFLLRALDTQNLIVSTISVFVSISAGYLVIKRSPFYALIYLINDVVLIVLWGMALRDSLTYMQLLISAFGFFFTDLYGFINWLNLRKKQTKEIQI